MYKSWYEAKKDLQGLQYINAQLKNDISSGINTLPVIDLYRYYNEVESRQGQYISQYINMEYPLLHEAVKFYEKMTALGSMEAESSYADHCCITAGATAAVTALFEYIHCIQPNASFLFLGYQYFLFGFLAKRYNFHYKTLTADAPDKNAPDASSVERELNENSYQYILLTQPFNPSGEMYKAEEIIRLIELAKNITPS